MANILITVIFPLIDSFPHFRVANRFFNFLSRFCSLRYSGQLPYHLLLHQECEGLQVSNLIQKEN